MLHLLLAGFLSAQAADTVSTVHLLRTHQFQEANPLLPSSTLGVVAVKSGVTLGVTALALHWRTTHPKLAKTVLMLGTGSGTYGAVHNLTLHPAPAHP